MEPRDFVEGEWRTGRVLGPEWVVMHVGLVRRIIAATSGLSLREIATQVEMTPMGVSNVLNGISWGDMRSFCKMATAFHVDMLPSNGAEAVALLPGRLPLPELAWGKSVVHLIGVDAAGTLVLTARSGDKAASDVLKRADTVVAVGSVVEPFQTFDKRGD